MKKFENILLLSDIDGTIAWNSEYIPPENIEKILYFKENGGHFAFSSGRNHKDIYRILPNLRELVSAPCILCNGSYLYDAETEEILNPRYLDEKNAVTLLHEIKSSFPTVGFRVTVPDGFLVPAGDAVMMRQLSEWGIADIATVRELSEFDGKEWFKAVFVADVATLSEVAAYIEARYSEVFTLTRSSEFLLELQPLGVSKSFQFPFLRSRYQSATLYAIGDYDNDAEMLRHADVAACPENASEEIKKIAAIHVCHCKDGALADLIEKIDMTL
ncbi:MAG: HAD hydrolase family protein [Clostridiales bacterium]|nr:HAD hydrolase family protein [Clostridiales bacterium]